MRSLSRRLTRARKAVEGGAFKSEIAPVSVPAKGGDRVISDDEIPLKVSPDKIPSLRPAFRPNGTITAASSSANADGAAALVLTRRSVAEQRGPARSWPRSARMRRTARSRRGSRPRRFRRSESCSPSPAGRPKDVDLFEINEAFAVVAMAAQKDLAIPREKLNVHGGACALGHPIGATGARLIVTLLHALEHHGLRKGVAAACIGGGEATAIAIERVN